MTKEKKILIGVVGVLALVSLFIGVSLAYFIPIIVGNDTASSHKTTSGSLRLLYDGTEYINLDNITPGATETKTFTITNTGTLTVDGYNVFFSNLVNTFINDEVVYTLTCSSSDAVNCNEVSQTPLPTRAGLILEQTSIAPNTTHTYTLTILFKETGLDQNYNQGQELIFKVTIDEVEHYAYNLIARQSYYSNELFWGYKASVTEITFEDEINVPANAFKSWDVSEAQNGMIMAYIIDDGLETNTYHLYIQSYGNKIYANPNSSYLFGRFEKLTRINNLTNLDTSKVTNMEGMFSFCRVLTSLDLSNFNTENVTNMDSTFAICESLTTLDLSSFNTSNVINMYSIFEGCSSLLNIDLSPLDTSNVECMNYMFGWCSSLTELDLSPLNTDSLLEMWGMFESLTGLTELDVSMFDTSRVTWLWGTFRDCSNLTTIDISAWDLTNVTLMNGVFEQCTNLTTIIYGTLDTSNVTNMRRMFKDCTSLTNIDVSFFNTANVIYMEYMFSGCTSLVSLDLSNFVTPKLKYANGMFQGSTALTHVNMSNATFTTTTSRADMFKDITSGINIIVKDATAKTWIETRLTEASKTGNVTIYVP